MEMEGYSKIGGGCLQHPWRCYKERRALHEQPRGPGPNPNMHQLSVYGFLMSLCKQHIIPRSKNLAAGLLEKLMRLPVVLLCPYTIEAAISNARW